MLLTFGTMHAQHVRHPAESVPVSALARMAALLQQLGLSLILSAVTWSSKDCSPLIVVQDGIVTMVDAKHVHKRLDDEVPDGAINEALEQIAYADRLILNKTDLVSPGLLSVVRH